MLVLDFCVYITVTSDWIQSYSGATFRLFLRLSELFFHNVHPDAVMP